MDRVVDDDGTHDLYDLRGLVQTQTVAGEGTYTYGYDAVGGNTSLTFLDGHTRIQIWDAEGRLTSRCYEYSPPNQTRCYTATYDPAGNPLTLTDPDGRSWDRIPGGKAWRGSDGSECIYDKFGNIELGEETFNYGPNLSHSSTRSTTSSPLY